MFAQLLKLTRPLILFDLETTGVETETARIWSLGMRIHKPGVEPASYKTLVNPGVSLPEFARETTQISDAIIKTGCAHCWALPIEHPNAACDQFKPVPYFKDLASNLHRGFRDADFGGFHVRYDLKVSAAEFGRCGLEFDYSGCSIIDGLRAWQVLEPRTLSDAVEYFLKRKMEGAHDAMMDIQETENVLIAQLTAHPRSDMLPRTVRELHDLLWPRDPNDVDSEGKFRFIDGHACFNFGANKGKRLSSNDPKVRGYLSWMVDRGGFSVEVKRIATAALNDSYPVPPVLAPKTEEP